MDGSFSTALMFSFIAGMSTGIGGLLVIMYGNPTFTNLGHMLSFSAGVMMFISFMDLLPEAIAAIGFVEANIWCFGGMAFMGLMVYLVPEPEFVPPQAMVDDVKVKEGEKGSNAKAVKEAKKKKAVDLKFLHNLGIITAIGISLHNFPEGIAVYLACLKGLNVGLPLTFAIAAHNIPEGMAVASPIYHATGSRWQAMKYTMLSGFCEPVGALLVGYFMQDYLTERMVHCLLASVAGIMILISIKELIPAALKYIDGDAAAISNVIGMFIIMVSIHLLHGEGGMHSHEHSHSHGHGHGHGRVDSAHDHVDEEL